eukprot:CAMPEP_0206051146 /NCGR_PEP_ID=MMETSP1466-20131121/30771_1 /ASSEMBLY_ACC=CAM_ASM_001126 /TAXON_ID=44452 /ORGANISM="Pavlova gyrans, Strain CCMP608" /LENGTH=497 /DNA_ID=CAMNT_0053426269 /DNA_START=33 /DNA_END=1526 /DNA_ORIENTATION=+
MTFTNPKRSEPSSRTPSRPADDARASVPETLRAINAALRAKGGPLAQYSCKTVSWDDVSRGTVGGSLSCWGSNITDTYLRSRNGEQLFTVRPDNWNEKLGRVSARDVAVVAGHTLPEEGRGLAPMTLRDFLARIGEHGAYAGLDPAENLLVDALDDEVSIRFQTTFIPIDGGNARGTLEFSTEAYNYNTTDDEDPRNLVLLCTTQGVAVQQDGAGSKRLFHHAIDAAGTVHRYWLEAERSDHRVGGPQKESQAERADALARGKATSSVIGIRALGQRFNVLMTVQLPLSQQKQVKRAPMSVSYSPTSPSVNECFAGACFDESEDDDDGLSCSLFEDEGNELATPETHFLDQRSAPRSASWGAPRTGVSNAARVSRGAEHDTWSGLSVKRPTRHANEHVTVTVVMYNTVAGGVPTAEDVAAAVEDLEELYASCSGGRGRLGDETFDFMKKELTCADAIDIQKKLDSQPYAPPPLPVANADVFPGAAAAAAAKQAVPSA